MLRLSEIYDEYIKKYPIYQTVLFSKKDRLPETLHPLYTISQYIIDTLISKNKKRIAIILPDDESNVFPLIINKYLSNVKYDQNYSIDNVFNGIEAGQRLRLGKAVVEFLCFDPKAGKRIWLRVDRNNPTIRNSYFIGERDYLFQKTTGAITSEKTWIREKKEVDRKIAESSEIINFLGTKKSLLKKTILVLSTKSVFYDSIEGLELNEADLNDLVLFGEIDNDSPSGFHIANKGNLEGKPAIAVTSKLEELHYFLKKDCLEAVSSIFSTIEKFYEISSNPDTFTKILLHNIPFIVFISEKDFAGCRTLEDNGFAIWHWKPATLNSPVMLMDNQIESKPPFFGKISQKVNCATLSDFRIETAVDCEVRLILKELRNLSDQVDYMSVPLRQIVRKLWFVQKIFLRLISPFEFLEEKIRDEIISVRNTFDKEKKYYSEQPFIVSIDTIINKMGNMLFDNNKKMDSLAAYLNINVKIDETAMILVSDDYNYLDEAKAYFRKYSSNLNLEIMKASDFINKQNIDFDTYHHLIVTWFDYREYIEIKQTYCYDYLVFILYDIEHKWREAFVDQINQYIPHNNLINLAGELNISETEFEEKVFDNIKTQAIQEIKEISDYDITGKIIKSTFGSKSDAESLSNIEYLPVILSGGKVGYFYPKHDIIDITGLIKDVLDRPVKKEAHMLKQGDMILVRQSDRDIIKEKADEMMSLQKESNLRNIVEEWLHILEAIAQNLSINDVQIMLKNAGADCSVQQIRYWLSGETIMPRDKESLSAIKKVGQDRYLLSSIAPTLNANTDEVFEAGKKVRAYHQRAGSWLSKELKYKANEIKALATSGKSSGSIDKIGNVNIYTIEEVLNIDYIDKAKLNKIECLY